MKNESTHPETHPVVLDTLEYMRRNPEIAELTRNLPIEFYDQIRASAWPKVFFDDERVTSVQQAIKGGEKVMLLLFEDGYVPVTVHADQYVDKRRPVVKHDDRD